MATAGQHVMQGATDLPGLSSSWYGTPMKDYSQMNYDGTGIRYRDDYVIVPTDQGNSMWMVKDVFGREVLGGRFTTIKLAKEFTDKYIDKLNLLKEKQELERPELEPRTIT
jgi:hypothetical protein